THNHPTDNTFSQNDIVTGLVKGNLKELRAVTSAGDVHILVNNGATEEQRKKFSAAYQQRRMKAANAADSKIRKGERINKDEYIKSRLEAFMAENAEDYNLTYVKSSIGKSEKPLANSGEGGIIKLDRRIASRNLPNGLRMPTNHVLTDDEIRFLTNEINAIGADISIFRFNEGYRTGYDDVLDEIRVRGDILPDLSSNHPRDRMSPRAALAHEYYGHRANRGTNLSKGAWNDEFRASYMAAKNCPNLTDSDRRYLILDAIERAKEKGVTIKYNRFIRRMLYGY
ncbi:MAG: hypothetical protein UIH27_14965, partial [Ruminococcus sp.]|nr:hypothetical protein [Ruminococcus sp.]